MRSVQHLLEVGQGDALRGHADPDQVGGLLVLQVVDDPGLLRHAGPEEPRTRFEGDAETHLRAPREAPEVWSRDASPVRSPRPHLQELSWSQAGSGPDVSVQLQRGSDDAFLLIVNTARVKTRNVR